jgi:hypothetical protein
MAWLLQGVAILLAVGLALRLPPRAGRAFRPLFRLFARVGRRRTAAVLLTGALAIGECVGLSLVVGLPVPGIHDEFSYLLAADTFASGRVANPTHPFWKHFESYHIIHEPTYASKYPPAQGIFLALGQLLGGHPAVGVWLSYGLACAAVTWMLQAWLSPRWALLGGLLLVFNPGWLYYWGHSYWGGATAVLGGALLLGALRRLPRRPRASQAGLLGIGVLLLANSRPFEGLVTSLPAAFVLLGWLVRQKPADAVFRVLLPGGLVLLAGGGAMLWYNQRVTGQPLLLPYEAHERLYALAPIFVFQPPRPQPEYRHKAMLDFHTQWALGTWQSQQGWANLLRASGRKLLLVWQFYLGPVYTVPLLALPWLLRDPWTRFALATCALVLAAMLASTFLQATYVSPITGLVYLVVVQGLRQVRLWRVSGRPTGRLLVGLILAVYAVSFVWGAVALGRLADPQRWERQRARIEAELEGMGGKHLVFVRYRRPRPGPEDRILQEWVYNRADIDGARIVWAREINPEEDQALRAYLADRQAWLVEPDVTPPRLTRLP